MDLAVLRDGETTWFARSPAGCPAFLSAPIVLIRGIYDRRPEMARQIVRHRIFTTAPLSASLQGMVKVAAKRITTGLEIDAPELLLEGRCLELNAKDFSHPPEIDSDSLSPSSDDNWMKVAGELASRIPKKSELYESDRKIAAILVSAKGEILSAAINTNARNRTQHAEINLIESLWKKAGKRLPRGSRLYTTLKPCKMCAGMIWDCAEDVRDLQVIYGEDDPGTNARCTALDLSPFPIQTKLGPLNHASRSATPHPSS